MNIEADVLARRFEFLAGYTELCTFSSGSGRLGWAEIRPATDAGLPVSSTEVEGVLLRCERLHRQGETRSRQVCLALRSVCILGNSNNFLVAC